MVAPACELDEPKVAFDDDGLGFSRNTGEAQSRRQLALIHERIAPLIKAPVTTIKTRGTVFAVIGGDYGFSLFDRSGTELAEFEDSQDAIGYELTPGDYKVIPSIDDDVHHHQFIEVLVKTD